MQSKTNSFTVTSFSFSPDGTLIKAAVTNENSEADIFIKKAEFENWLTDGNKAIAYVMDFYNPADGHTQIEGQTTLDDYWRTALEVNNTDALEHLHIYLTKDEETQFSVVGKLERERIMSMVREMYGSEKTFLDEYKLMSALMDFGLFNYQAGMRIISDYNLKLTA